MKTGFIYVISFSIRAAGGRFVRAYEDPDPERDRESV